MEEAAPKINVREVLHSKAPTAHVPDFLVRYLERIVHQDQINGFLETQQGITGTDFIVNSLKFLGVSAESSGLDKIPEGRYTFVGNHPLGGIDGIATGLEIHKRFPAQSIKYISNDLLSNLKNLSPIFIPVNKVGDQSQSRSLPQRLTEAFASDVQMVIFPSGACSRRVKGEITELKWNKTFIVKSVESKRDIVPVYFEGRNSNFFYNLANLRTWLGIKINLEMLYLADEMFKQRGNHYKIRFGKPIPYTTFDESKTPQGWADYVRGITLSLKQPATHSSK